MCLGVRNSLRLTLVLGQLGLYSAARNMNPDTQLHAYTNNLKRARLKFNFNFFFIN